MKSRKHIVAAMTLTIALLSNGAVMSAQERAKKTESQKREVVVFSSSSANTQVTTDPNSQTFAFVAGQEGQNVSVRAGDGTFAFVSSEMAFDRTPVKGAPYAGEAVTESVQTLADGNRIVRRSNAMVYRDTEGRTRREQTIKPMGPYSAGGEDFRTIFINDPVSGTSYTLNSKDKTAHKHTLHIARLRPKTEAQKQEAETDAAQRKAEAGAVIRGAVESAVASSFEFRVEGPGAVAFGPHDRMSWLGKKEAKKESLGTQMIEGVQAEGTRTTITIAAGEIGNEQPINIVSERWYSNDLKLVVMSRHSDPRFGETTYKLTNINRSEPSPSLFEVPAEYTIQEPSSFKRMPRVRARENNN